MKKKNFALATYIIVFFACVWLCSEEANVYSVSGYNAEIEKLSYQLKYTDLYSNVYSSYSSQILETSNTEDDSPDSQEKKMVYLTFDDGPSPRTGEILDILKKHDVKATFFVIKVKDEYTQYMTRAAKEGHTIGVHSASHKYKEIYRSVDDYLSDFTQCYNYIFENTGHEPTIYRFPGGSVNNFNAATRKDIVREMSRRGFIYFDWNVESNDSSSNMSAQDIYNNVISGCEGKSRAVIIMHDAVNKKTTVEALDRIITRLKDDGWQFSALTNEVRPVIFRMK